MLKTVLYLFCMLRWYCRLVRTLPTNYPETTRCHRYHSMMRPFLTFYNAAILAINTRRFVLQLKY